MGDPAAKVAEISSILARAYDLQRDGAFAEAEPVIEQALALDYENKEVLSALKCANYWKEKKARLATIRDPYDQAEFLLKAWRGFMDFLDQIKDVYDSCLYSIRQWVFGKSIVNYLHLLESGGADPDLFFRIGRCFKGLGDYQHAVEYLEAANSGRRDDPEIVAELADCYALVNEIKASKAFFREAFFLDPQKIDVKLLDSLLIRRLVDRLRAMGYSSPALEEWIPVYGVLFGVLNVKRELKSLEYGKLRQSIFALENQLDEDAETRGRLAPRLINRYLWLIDHYMHSGEEREKIDEVLHKIRDIDVSVYEQIVN
jgi:tetratricopeptide (TPR) repeat protein